MTWTELTSGSLARADHNEDRFTIHTFKVPDNLLPAEDDGMASYVVSACREACNDNTHHEDRACKDFGTITTSAGVGAELIQRGAADTGTSAGPSTVASDGDDIVIAGPGNDVIDGGAGDDTLDGG